MSYPSLISCFVMKANDLADLSIHWQSTHKEKDTHQEQRMVSYEFTG